MYKNNITEEEFYDNTEKSILLFKATTNTLKLRDWYRHLGENTECQICRNGEENLEHFLIECISLSQVREKIEKLTIIKDDNERDNNIKIISKCLLFTDNK